MADGDLLTPVVPDDQQHNSFKSLVGEGGLNFGGFADDEKTHPKRWADVIAADGALVFRWKAGCIEENVINAVPDAQLEQFLTQDDKTGARLAHSAASGSRTIRSS